MFLRLSLINRNHSGCSVEKRENIVPTMRARLYAIIGNPKKEPTGQAARVLTELRRDTTPRLAEDIDKAIATSDTPHKTRQDSLRVTLYYLLVFKKQGIVAATEQPQPAEAVAEATDEVEETVEA